VNFLVDAQLPPALARWITTQGHNATHVFDLGFHTAVDPAIWNRAETDQCILITKDEDFVDHWLISDRPVPLVWIRKGNCSNKALLTWLAPMWSDTVNRLQHGEKLIELRG